MAAAFAAVRQKPRATRASRMPRFRRVLDVPGASDPRPDVDALSILKEASDQPVDPEEPAADANSLLHRLAAGGLLSPVGLTLCRHLIEENSGYQPDSVLEVAICEGQFSPEDLPKIATFLVSIYYEPGADTCANESMARNVFEVLAEKGGATQELVKLCVQAMAPCVSLTRPVHQYLKKAGRMVGAYRAMAIAAFNWENYSAYCRKQPAAEEKGAPPAGVPSERTLHYFLLRRAWLKGRESPGSLRALGQLLRATAAKPQWKPLHDRAVLVFRDHWSRGQYGRATAMAAQVCQGLLGLQPNSHALHTPRVREAGRVHMGIHPSKSLEAAGGSFLVRSMRRRYSRWASSGLPQNPEIKDCRSSGHYQKTPISPVPLRPSILLVPLVTLRRPGQKLSGVRREINYGSIQGLLRSQRSSATLQMCRRARKLSRTAECCGSRARFRSSNGSPCKSYNSSCKG